MDTEPWSKVDAVVGCTEFNWTGTRQRKTARRCRTAARDTSDAEVAYTSPTTVKEGDNKDRSATVEVLAVVVAKA